MARKLAEKHDTPYIAAMSKNAKPLVLFDLVSTITDAGPRYAQAYIKIAEEFKIAVPASRDILNELGQRNLKEIINIHSPDLSAEKIPEFMQSCNNFCDALLHEKDWVEKLYPHVRETLADLKAQGYTLGLYTGTRKDAALNQLRYHKLEEFFPEDMIRAKDNQADDGKDSQALKAAQMTSLMKAAHGNAKNPVTIVIGDTISDFEAARENKAVFMGFADSTKKVFRFAQAGVLTAFTNFERLPGMIKLATSPAWTTKNPANTDQAKDPGRPEKIPKHK